MKEKLTQSLERVLKNKVNLDQVSEIRSYLDNYDSMINQLSPHEVYREIVSGYNRMIRRNEWSSVNFNIDVCVGDICFVDFGHSYINEVAFQHCALVISIFNYKAFVVPMTSNLKTLSLAKNIREDGKDHLYYIGQVAGLNKPSVIFLNDAQYINTSRVISKSSRIDPESILFKQILRSLKKCIFNSENR